MLIIAIRDDKFLTCLNILIAFYLIETTNFLN